MQLCMDPVCGAIAIVTMQVICRYFFSELLNRQQKIATSVGDKLCVLRYGIIVLHCEIVTGITINDLHVA